MLRIAPVGILAGTLALVGPGASAETFRWASQTDPGTMDPHAESSTPVLGFLNNVYEGLVRRAPDMAIEPALATAWEPIGEGEGWRFTLREGVTFHDGAPFTAEDVRFSYERASSEQADVASWFATVEDVVVVDEFTVDVLTTQPDPIFPDAIANWMMMDSGWAEANGTESPARDAENFATLNANGTGPFRLASRQPGLETVLEPFEGWWGEPEHNITRAVFTPIENAATGVAALLAGDVDMINPVPVQDAPRLDAQEGVRVIRGTEARVILLGLAHEAETLHGGDAGAPNPLRDVRVRRAIAHAIDVPAIVQTILRGTAKPVAQLTPPGLRGATEGIEPLPHDPEAARALLAEAGYPDGFALNFKCTNDRYLNDESVCQAITAMLAQVGIRAELEALPTRNYWPELREGAFDLYLVGWSPGTFDAEHPIRFLVASSEGDLGTWNFGGFSSARVDELLPRIQSEIDEAQRQAMLDEVAGIVADEVAYVPLYVQPLLWGVRENVELVQRPDDFLILRWVRVE